MTTAVEVHKPFKQLVYPRIYRVMQVGDLLYLHKIVI
jgi:hypothetical protein